MILGTAQFGGKYGIANKKKITKRIIFKILNKAKKLGVRQLDTAQDYNLSEKNIGIFLKKKNNIFKITTKISNFAYLKSNQNKSNLIKKVDQQFKNSLKILNVNKVNTLLLHKYDHLKKWDGAIWEYLKFQKNMKKTNLIGVSINSKKELKQALCNKEINVIQLPVNIFDYRWREKNILNILKRKKKYFQARRIFLQGIIFLPKTKWPKSIQYLHKRINNKMDFLVKKLNRVNSKDLCVSYCRSIKWVNKLIIGVDNDSQLEEIFYYFKQPKLRYKEKKIIEDTFKHFPTKFLMPSLWYRN